MQKDTNCTTVKRRFQIGDEIATHTWSHYDFLEGGDEATVEYEVIATRQFLEEECELPRGSVQGFRAPYLHTLPIVRKVLYVANFTYDSTATIYDPNFPNRYWPYTLHAGLAKVRCCPKHYNYNRLN